MPFISLHISLRQLITDVIFLMAFISSFFFMSVGFYADNNLDLGDWAMGRGMEQEDLLLTDFLKLNE